MIDFTKPIRHVTGGLAYAVTQFDEGPWMVNFYDDEVGLWLVTSVRPDDPQFENIPEDTCDNNEPEDDRELIERCYRLRSLGAAIRWDDVDRIVEIAAGKPLDRRPKRCPWCDGTGHEGVNQ